ncbi:nuclease A inhibitor family protein [Pontibacter chitinilyticus]|uniref:nuclease A inhibitor family protein n=1 Tax=Pontibacter chitinilyticus TaxID=2674989 RepID=UPI003219770A
MENTETAAATAALLEELRQYSEGLQYISETEAPFEVVCFPDFQGDEPTEANLTLWAGKALDEPIETTELPHFLQHLTTAAEDQEPNASRFQQLQQLLELRLQDVKVYRIGRRRITAFILGRTATGTLAGLKTTLVET